MSEAAAPKAAKNVSARKGQAFKDKEKPTEVRMTNITAAKGIFYGIFCCVGGRQISDIMSFSFSAVANAIRTSLGPKGMDKMVCLQLLMCQPLFDSCFMC